MSSSPSSSNPKPDYVLALESIYGVPSQSGFGSAVFYEPLEQADALEATALEYYRYFVGDLWQRFGEAAWMSAWKLVYTRQPGVKSDIVAELQAIADPNAQSSAAMILDNISDLAQGQQTLSLTYDDATVKTLVVYTVGDGAAMSGVLVAGRRKTGETTFLVFLMD